MTPDNPLILAFAALISAAAAWLTNGFRLKRIAGNTNSIEQMVSDAVTKNYHQLVSEVATLRSEVSNLSADVKKRDARIDELESDKRAYAARIDELEREITELRDELSNYRPTRRRKTTEASE